uniref:non-specific serine/threonine protein kinase n=1 Tax=Setaria italica TaxID=4555 RepID=K3XSA4_SETIT
MVPLMAALVSFSSLPVSGAQTNITSGASLQAAAGAGWPSPSGRFAFGFYATDGGLAVGVWLATAPNVTVTWTADRDKAPATGGAVRITSDGRLVWAGANGGERSLAVPPQPAVAAAMRDDGSFVLYGANGTVDLVPGAQLFSSVSDTSWATGRYRLANQLEDGNLVTYPVQTHNNATSSIDPDGILRRYRHAVASTGAWSTDVDWIGPSDRCQVKGVCGLNSYCVLDSGVQPRCVCPPGFDLIDATNAALGCNETTGAGDCAAAAAAGLTMTMAAMQDMWWADTPYGSFVGAADCQAACMADCLCAAVRLNGNDGTCTTQKLPLRYGRTGGGYTLFVRNAAGTADPALGGRGPTGGFREPVDRGAFGTVFRGTLHGGEGERAIAVKRLEKVVEEGEHEFQREVRAIGRTSHRNLGAHRLLVYEYVSNGSLAARLFLNKPCPSWSERVGIPLDVARGLHYLHDELESRVIHCDVQPQNILMDASGTAKIADFGLAKLLLPDQTRTFTGVRGTRGYLAPEWYRGAGPLTVKADVYSYGVVLLETVTCRRSMELEEAGEERTIMELAHECLVAGEVRRVMGSVDDDAVEAAEVERAVKVAVWCAQAEPQARPAMRTVILMLEGHVKVPFPPPPASS